MAFKVYEDRASGVALTSYDADTLDEAVEIIAREKSENANSYSNKNNVFRLVEIVTAEKDIPFRISIGGGDRGATASCGDVTVTA